MGTYSAGLFDALGDPTRRAVFERLRGGPLAVSRIAEGLDVRRPAVSQHLKVLKDAGLVRDSRSGTRRIYAVAEQALAALRDWLDGFWDEALTAFKSAAEQAASKEQAHAARQEDRVRRRPGRGRGLPYVAVDDPDATIARAGKLGGKIHVGPEDIPRVGHFGVLEDPTGEVLAVMKALPPTKKQA